LFGFVVVDDVVVDEVLEGPGDPILLEDDKEEEDPEFDSLFEMILKLLNSAITSPKYSSPSSRQ
jgi:hypothetical protein